MQHGVKFVVFVKISMREYSLKSGYSGGLLFCVVDYGRP
jgi:hypothetical protein